MDAERRRGERGRILFECLGVGTVLAGLVVTFAGGLVG